MTYIRVEDFTECLLEPQLSKRVIYLHIQWIYRDGMVQLQALAMDLYLFLANASNDSRNIASFSLLLSQRASAICNGQDIALQLCFVVRKPPGVAVISIVVGKRFQEEKQDRFGMSEPNEHFALDNISAHCTWIKRSVETTAAIHYIEEFVE